MTIVILLYRKNNQLPFPLAFSLISWEYFDILFIQSKKKTVLSSFWIVIFPIWGTVKKRKEKKKIMSFKLEIKEEFGNLMWKLEFMDYFHN